MFVEVEQAQKQPAVAETFFSTSVANVGNHVARNDQENNQAFFNEYEVNFLCMGKYCLELMLRCTYINFMQQTTAVYENTDGQLLMNGCIVAHRFFKKMFLSTFSS